ncbi:MAG: MFS transporter [Spirochaetia bacterium]|jgi:oligogalacturonide transporter|nr:MFS transporter [Spirochaetia bacterium]
MNVTEPVERQLRIRNCVAYGLGDLYGGGAFLLVSTFTMYYLVAVVGMNPLLAGLIPGLGKIWDAVSDPLMGYLSDRTRSRFGRRRVWFLAGIIPIFLSVSLIWLPVRLSSDLGLFVFYFLAYLFFYTVSTMVLVPYGALSAEMAREFKDRNKLTGFRMLFSMLAALLSGTIPQLIINAFPDQRSGHLVMGLVFGAFFAAPWLITYLGTWDDQAPASARTDVSGNTPGFISNFASIFRNRSFRIHIAMYIFAYATMDVLMGWLKFYLADYLGRPGFLTIALGSILLTQILAIPLYISIANRKGHASAYRLGLGIMILGMVGMYFHTPETPRLVLVINCMVVGLGQSAAVLVPFQLLPFVADVDELITGDKRAGTYAGAMTLIRKLVQGAAVLPLLGLTLSLIGYLGPVPLRFSPDELQGFVIPRVAAAGADTALLRKAYLMEPDGLLTLDANLSSVRRRELRRILEAADYKGSGASRITVQTPQQEGTPARIRALFAFLPILLLTTGFAVSFRFKLDPGRHKIMMAEVERLRVGGSKTGVPEEAKAVCELLSGLKYEDCFAGGVKLVQ